MTWLACALWFFGGAFAGVVVAGLFIGYQLRNVSFKLWW